MRQRCCRALRAGMLNRRSQWDRADAVHRQAQHDGAFWCAYATFTPVVQGIRSPMPPKTTIRPYAAGDEAALLDVWNEAMWADPIDETTWRSRYLLDPNFSPGECLVAVDPATDSLDGFVLGFTGKCAGTPTDAWVVGFGVPAHLPVKPS